MFDESNDRFYSKLFAGGTEGQYFYNQDNPDFSSIGGSQLSGGFSPYSGIGGAGSGSFGVGGNKDGRTDTGRSHLLLHSALLKSSITMIRYLPF